MNVLFKPQDNSNIVREREKEREESEGEGGGGLDTKTPCPIFYNNETAFQRSLFAMVLLL